MSEPPPDEVAHGGPGGDPGHDGGVHRDGGGLALGGRPRRQRLGPVRHAQGARVAVGEAEGGHEGGEGGVAAEQDGGAAGEGRGVAGHQEGDHHCVLVRGRVIH